jgi:hypothetical protein
MTLCPSLNDYVMRRSSLALVAASVVITLISAPAWAAVSYSVIGSNYTQNFSHDPMNATQTLPMSPTNTSLVGIAEWADDTTTPPANHVSIPGWYLFHPLDPGAEDGNNGNQRLRAGSGNSTTGAFYSYGVNGETDRALGSLASTTLVTNDDFMYMGVRLTNNTGVTLNDFTVTYAGEQWRDGAGNNGNPEKLLFQYSTIVDINSWNGSVGYTGVGQLDFTAPVNAGDAAVAGNTLATSGGGRVEGITHTVSGVGWAPGTDLWLRWADLGAAANDDGLAIDDFVFSAVEGTPGGGTNIVSVQSGSADVGSTWSNNMPQSVGNTYDVLSGHTVTVPSNFLGTKLTVKSGATVDISNGSGLNIPWLVVESGGNLTESVSGNFYLGNISASPLNILQANSNLTFNIDAGSEFGLDMNVVGTGDIDFNANAGSVLYLSAAQDLGGTIRFNGTGGEIRLLEEEGYNYLELNSPGAVLLIDPSANLTAERLTINQSATVVHASETNRLQGAATFLINAATTLDLSELPGGLEKRFLTSAALEGSANLTVNGTSSAPSGTGLNEFEIGSQGTTENEPTNLATSSYSGTVTLNNFVNMEVRHHMPSASFVVNSNAVLEMGHMKREAANSVRMGSIEVISGGTLEIGMAKAAGGIDGHFAYHLTLDDSGGESGGLVLHDGAQLNMQINGDPMETTLFDRITADGAVTLDGTLMLFVNPEACVGNTSCNAGQSYDNAPFSPYVPNAGDTWTLIQTTLDSPLGDYNLDGTVDNSDVAEWQKYFGTNNTNADGNKDGIVDAADFIVVQKNLGATGSGALITGTFDSIVDDLAGFHFVPDYSAPGQFKVTLVADGAGSGGQVPEPSTLAMFGLVLAAAGAWRRSHSLM